MQDATEQMTAVWHQRDMARVAKRLHDRIGPALCAAGLHLSLMENAIAAAPGSDSASAAAGLRAALTESTEEIRTLSYLCDPSLVERLGLKAALGYLARAVPINPATLTEVPSRKDAAASTAFSLLRTALLYWTETLPEAAFSVQSDKRSVRVTSNIAAPEHLAEFLRQSGATVPASRLSITLKLPTMPGGPSQ